MQDRDLAPLRERREWRDAVETMQGGLSRQSLVAVRAEQKSPFRYPSSGLLKLRVTWAGSILSLILSNWNTGCCACCCPEGLALVLS